MLLLQSICPFLWLVTWLNISTFHPLFSGQKSITQKFSAVSAEIPGMIVDFELFVEIEKQFPKSFLDNDYRILSIKLVNAGSVPESWLGANFTASIPIPKANNEAQGICLAGKTESVAIENDVTLSWSTPDGQGRDFSL